MVTVNKHSIQKIFLFLENLFLVAVGSGLVFAVGFLCQFLIINIFSECCGVEYVLWENANQPLYFAITFLSFCGSALFPGFIFALLINFHRNKIWWVGALYGILSLSAYDVALSFMHKDINLLTSIFFNILGGPIGGIIAVYWARVVYANSNRNFAWFGNIAVNLCLYFFALSSLFLVMFFFFLYPIPQPVRMNLDASQNFSIALKKSKFIGEFSFKEESDLGKFSEHFPFLKKFDVEADVNTFSVYNLGGDIGNQSLNFITDKKAIAKIIGIRGCTSIEEAIKTAKKYPKKYLEVGAQDISFFSIGSYLKFFQKPQGKVSLYLPYEKPIARVLDEKKFKVFSWSPLLASIPLKSESYIYFTGGPDFTKAIDKRIFPEKASDFEKVKIEIGDKSFTVPIVSKNPDKCETLDLREEHFDSTDTLRGVCLNSGFLIQINIEEAGEYDVLKVNIPNASWITIDDGIERLFTSKDENLDVISFEAERIKGALKVGQRETSVENERVRIKGAHLNVLKEEDRVILKGTARIVLINEQLLTKSIFFLLGTPFQILLLTTLGGFLAYLANRFKSEILRCLKEIFDGDRMPIKILR
jgi:hypothetical protein